jgi:hypothetical protein
MHETINNFDLLKKGFNKFAFVLLSTKFDPSLIEMGMKIQSVEVEN